MIQLRPHQIAAADAVEDAFRVGTNRPLVDMCVGAGKSLTYAELARRAWLRGERTIIAAHRSELVEQNAKACRALGLHVGINAASLDERTWRAPVICCQVNSVFRSANAFGPIGLFCGDEAHLWPHSESGMFRELHRGLGYPRLVGGSGTPYRLLGGSLTSGEGAPFDRTVYTYSIIDGIRDGYLVAPYSQPVDDKLDVSRLRVRQGEYTPDSQDAQMLALIDNHIAQMIHFGSNRRAWLIFEASTKSAKAMHERLNQWGIPTGLVLGSKSKADEANRRRVTEEFRAGRLRAIVNLDCLTTGFDVQEVDMLVCRRRTKSLSLWIQIVGRLLRTIGGNIEASIAAGKADGLLLDYAGNDAEFGPLDFIRPKDTKSRLVSCETCGKRNGGAAMRCWSCDQPIHKLCPACLANIPKGTLDCTECGHDMRIGTSDGAAPRAAKLLETPSGAALIAAFGKVQEKAGGWIPIRKAYAKGDETFVLDNNGGEWALPGALSGHAVDARWIRGDAGAVLGLLKPNGALRTTVMQVTPDGMVLPVPMPPSAAGTVV
jgi:DNA repair protein RadD